MKRFSSPTHIFLIILCITIAIFVMISVFIRQNYDEIPTQKSDWNPAHTWAYHLWITTIPDIDKANMDGLVYRKTAAKMMSEFAIKIFGCKPDRSRKCEFTDISNEIKEMQGYIILSCQLGIMGLDYHGDPTTIFNPDYVLTRDQLVTVLSRILFDDTYNIKEWEITFTMKVRNFFIHTLSNISQATGIPIHITPNIDRYTKHMDTIRKLGVITNYDPTTKEFRGYVMTIMQKLDHMKMTTIQTKIK